jgi:hypothetical protein
LLCVFDKGVDAMNLIFSYSVSEDEQLETEGHIFLGAGEDRNGREVHVFLDKDKSRIL